jgi:hypothetical protein
MKQTMKKIARVNMSTGKYRTDDIPSFYRGLGGRGLTSRLGLQAVVIEGRAKSPGRWR